MAPTTGARAKPVSDISLQRKPLRASFTTLTGKIQTELTKVSPSLEELSGLRDQLQDKMNRLQVLDEKMQEAILSLGSDDSDLETTLQVEFQSAEEYREKGIRSLSVVSDVLKRSSSRSGVSTPSTSSSLDTTSNNGAIVNGNGSAFKVHEYRLPKFSGKNPRDYPGWIDQFRALIDNNPQLSAVQKFGILKDSLTDTPRQLISSLLTTEENYEAALKVLDESFGDANLLLGLFVSHLHSFSAVKDTKSSAFQELVFGFDQTFGEIQNMIKKLLPESTGPDVSGVVNNVISFFLTPHLLSKLPYETQMKWCEKHSEPADRYNFPALLNQLKQDIRSRNACVVLGEQSRSHREPHRERQTEQKYKMLVNATSEPGTCRVCQQDAHYISRCPLFLSSGVSARRGTIDRLKLCSNCMKSHPTLRVCPSRGTCRRCNEKHHTLLCKQPPAAGPIQRDVQGTGQGLSNHVNLACIAPKSVSVLQVVEVLLCSPDGERTVPTNALLDTGSSLTWVRGDLAKLLKLPAIEERQMAMDVFGQQATQRMVAKQVCLTVSGADGREVVKLAPWVAKTLTQPLTQPVEVPHEARGLGRFAPYDGRPKEIGLLIGIDVYHDVVFPEVVGLRPRAQRTRFGWTLMGKYGGEEVMRVNQSYSHVESLWELDGVGITESPQEQEDPFQPPQLVNGRFEVRLPFRSCARPQSNFKSAHGRDVSLRKKLSDKEELEYDSQIKKLIGQGYVERVKEPSSTVGFFMPLFGVKSKGKLRVVFDGSAVDARGISLNDCLDTGPNLLALVFDILIRFRIYSSPLVTDMTAAFHQLQLHVDDRPWVQFVWKGEILRFSRVPFGLNCGPFLLLHTLRHFYKTLEPALGKFLQSSTYMDDVVSSLPDANSRDTVLHNAVQAFSQVGITLRESDGPTLLGLPYSRQEDSIAVNMEKLCAPKSYTRRELLRNLASVFDPLGLVSPYTIRGRMLLQEAWRTGLKWDDELPKELKKLWDDWENDRGTLSVPRWIGLKSQDDDVTLHIFCDASVLAYACAAYVSVRQRGISYLLASKARVAPLKAQLTVPKAELMAVTIGVRLLHHLYANVLSCVSAVVWTDSQTVLHWLTGGGPRGQVFIRNRLQEIRNLTCDIPKVQFRYVRTEENPADLPSRGGSFRSLKTAKWLSGPAFLTAPCDWPTEMVVLSMVTVGAEVADDRPRALVLDPEEAESLDHLVRVCAWTRRYIHNRLNSRGPRKSGPLGPQEERDAFNVLLRREQRKAYAGEYDTLHRGGQVPISSSIAHLRPYFCNQQGLILVHPRTQEDGLPLLPKKSKLTHLFIRQIHTRFLHPGPHATLAEVRTGYWVPNGLSTVKVATGSCVPCRRYKRSPFAVPEGCLPAFRTQKAVPFSVTGVDFFGPLYSDKGNKLWVLLFTCAVTRAIHLEVCQEMSAVHTHHRIREFLALRVPVNQPVTFYSDNGKAFLRCSDMRFPLHPVCWRFIPDYAPTFGGWWERLVRTVKTSLRASFHGERLTEEQFRVVFAEIIATVNRRPLTAVSTSLDDSSPLTPSHFLFGEQPVEYLPQGGSLDGCLPPATELRRYSKKKQQLLRLFWDRWKKEYLSSLRPWRTAGGNLSPAAPEIGDLVYLKLDGAGRKDWRIGKVVRLIYGNDGVPRSAIICTRSKKVVRETQRRLASLIPLELSQDSKSLPSRRRSPRLNQD